MRTIYFLSLLVAPAFFASAQTELNGRDAAGKKHGKWNVYLDKDWKALSDSAGAKYRRYTFYDHGINLYPMGSCGGKNYTLELPVGDKSSACHPLDGEYKWYNAKGQLSSVHVFKNGEYVSCKEYFPAGVLSQHFDYTKQWQNEEHTWCVYIYDRQGNLVMTSWMKKDKNGNWPKTKG